MDYEQAQRRVDQLRRELNAAADRIRELAEQVENLGAELPVILEDAPEEISPGAYASPAWNKARAEAVARVDTRVADKCTGCQYRTIDGRCLFAMGCAWRKRP